LYLVSHYAYCCSVLCLYLCFHSYSLFSNHIALMLLHYLQPHYIAYFLLWHHIFIIALLCYSPLLLLFPCFFSCYSISFPISLSYHFFPFPHYSSPISFISPFLPMLFPIMLFRPSYYHALPLFTILFLFPPLPYSWLSLLYYVYVAMPFMSVL